MKKAQQKKASRHIYSSGLAGCGGKAEPTAAKNSGQEMPCPYCDRTFKQDGRLKEHVKSKHAGESEQGVEGASGTAGAQQKNPSAGSSAKPPSDGATTGGNAAGTGGASTSGTYFVKTPKIQLNEWCQRNKRPSAKYKPVQVEGGSFHCRAVLPDPRDASNDIIVWFRGEGADTSDMAQQRAATVALHRVMGDRRMDRVLPPDFRQQWLDLDREAEQRQAAAQQRASQFPSRGAGAGPQQPRQQQPQAAQRREMEQRRERVQVYLSQDRRQLVEALLASSSSDGVGIGVPPGQGSGAGSMQGQGGGAGAGASAPGPAQGAPLHGGLHAGAGSSWQGGGAGGHAAHGAFGPLAQQAVPGGVQQLVQQLQALGFATAWAKRAAEARPGDYMAARDWLVLNVPEAELPRKFAPSSSAAAVTVLQSYRGAGAGAEGDRGGSGARDGGSHDAEEWEVAAGDVPPDCRWLCSCGFELHRVKEALQGTGGDETAALEELLREIGAEGMGADGGEGKAEGGTEEAVLEAREEEAVVLEAIYGEDVERTEGEGPGGATVRWTIRLAKEGGEEEGGREEWERDGGLAGGEDFGASCLFISVTIPPSSKYPFSPPLIAFHTPLALPQTSPSPPAPLSPPPPLLRSFLLRATAAAAAEACQQPLGSGMVHALLLWAGDCVRPQWQALLRGGPVPLLQEAGAGHVGPAAAADAAADSLGVPGAPHAGQAAGSVGWEGGAVAEEILQEQLEEPAGPGGAAAVPTASARAPHSRRPTAADEREDAAALGRESARLREEWAAKLRSRLLQGLLAVRRALPMWAERERLLSAVQRSRVVVVSGQTGCGKSTQVPQFLLEEALEAGRGAWCSVVVTQPRRIAAVSLAQRVAAERGESVGDTVGYAVRLDSRRSPRTRLLFCTTGVLLRRLLAQPLLPGVSHIVVDEVHERSLDSDLLLLLLRVLLLRRSEEERGAQGKDGPNRQSLRIILMSATADAALFADYFRRIPQALPLLPTPPAACLPSSRGAGGASAAGSRAPPLEAVLGAGPLLLSVPGRTHPVKQLFLEDALEVTGVRIGRHSKYALKGPLRKQAEAVAGGGGQEGVGGAEARALGDRQAAGDGATGEAGDEEEGEGEEDEEEGNEEESVPQSWDDGDSVGGESARGDGEEGSSREEEGTKGHGRVAQANGAAPPSRAAPSPLPHRASPPALAGYSEATQKSLQWVDESVIHYELIERVLCAIMTAKAHADTHPPHHHSHSHSHPHTHASPHPPPHSPHARLLATLLPDCPPAQASSCRGVLVFLPGMAEIRRLQSLLVASKACWQAAGGSGRMQVLPLHGSLGGEEQQRVFRGVGEGVWKVVLATNIAETSVTIDDIVWVIDTGRQREIAYDASRNMPVLQDAFVSQAAAAQRSGRAGRRQPGCCVRLLSRNTFDGLPAQADPEILRVPLEALCLQVKSLLPHLPASVTLSQAITPPSQAAVAAAIRSLTAISALLPAEPTPPPPSLPPPLPPPSLPQDGGLSALGRQLALLPLDVHVGKMLIFSLLLRCLDPLLSVAAALSLSRPLFRSAPPSEPALRQQYDAAKRRFAGASRSDHVAMAVAYSTWERLRRGDISGSGDAGAGAGGRVSEAGGRHLHDRGGRGGASEKEVWDWCWAQGVSHEMMEQTQLLRRELVQALAGAGLLSDSYVSFWLAKDEARGGRSGQHLLPEPMFGGVAGDPFNSNASVWRVVKSAIAAGCYPNVVRVKRPPQQFVQTEHGAVPKEAPAKALRFLSRAHGRVFLHPASVNFAAGGFESPWLVYSEATMSAVGPAGGAGGKPAGSGRGSKDGRTHGGSGGSSGSSARAKVQLRESTMVPSLALLLLGGSVGVNVETRHVAVDHWAEFEAPGRVGLLVLEMRKRVDAVLAAKLEAPHAVDLGAPDATLEALAQLLGAEGGG